jgi:hypothetical protein
MPSMISRLSCCALLLVCGGAWAQPIAAPAASAPGEPVVQRKLIEDDNVRIEELSVRGQTQRITVQSKIGGVRPYEIIVGPGGRDPSKERSTAGQSAWRMFSF